MFSRQQQTVFSRMSTSNLNRLTCIQNTFISPFKQVQNYKSKNECKYSTGHFMLKPIFGTFDKKIT